MRRAEAVEPPAGFGKVPFSRVGQGQVGPIGGEFHLLRGGHPFVQPGDGLVDPAGAEQEPAQCVREQVPVQGAARGVAESRFSNQAIGTR